MATVGTVEDLRTIRDFEEKAGELCNPKAQEWEYAINSFGYCRKCKAVTQYEGDYSIEGCRTTCMRCEETFGEGGLDSELYTTELEEMPKEARLVVVRLQSRGVQTRLFLEALAKFIAKRKRGARHLQSSVRTLRALEKKVKAARESAD